MPYRKNNRGSWRIKANFGFVANVRVGKIDLPLGVAAEDEKLAKSVEDSLRGLPVLGVHGAQLLIDFRDGRRSATEIHALVREQKAKEIPVILNAEPLEEAWLRFLDNARRKGGERISARTRHDYGLYLRYFLRIDPNAAVHDLPRLLQHFKDECMDAKPAKPSTYMKALAASKAFARNTQAEKQFSPLYRDVQRVGAVTLPEHDTNTALPVYQVRELIERIPDTRIQHLCWTMALTGMSMGEYVNDFSVHADRVHINGEKNHRRDRDVPKLMHEIVPVPIAYYVPGKGTLKNTAEGKRIPHDAINQAIRDASDMEKSSNVFRHSYALWLENARIPETRIRRYSGWAPSAEDKVRDNYTKSEFEAFLIEDTKTLCEYVERNWKRPKGTKPEKIKRLKIGSTDA